MTREEAIVKINILRNEYNDRYIDYCGVNEAVNMAIKALKAEPVRRGGWIEDKELSAKHTEKIYRCSACENFEAWGETEKYNYCPNCGAKMKESF